MSNKAELVAHQYADYVKIDFSAGANAIEETIDETLTRLDEYSGLIDMVHIDSSIEKSNSFLEWKADLEIMFEKIRKLEFLVARIKADVYQVESLLCKAESELGISTEGKLRQLLKPLFKRTNSLSDQSKAQVKFEAPELFSTQDFF